MASSPECPSKGHHSRLLRLERVQGRAVPSPSVLMETKCMTTVAGHVPRKTCKPVPLASSRMLLLFAILVCKVLYPFIIHGNCLASLPGLPTVQFLIACSIHLHFYILQVIKNWTVGRPGNEASNCHLYFSSLLILYIPSAGMPGMPSSSFSHQQGQVPPTSQPQDPKAQTGSFPPSGAPPTSAPPTSGPSGTPLCRKCNKRYANPGRSWCQQCYLDSQSP